MDVRAVFLRLTLVVSILAGLVLAINKQVELGKSIDWRKYNSDNLDGLAKDMVKKRLNISTYKFDKGYVKKRYFILVNKQKKTLLRDSDDEIKVSNITMAFCSGFIPVWITYYILKFIVEVFVFKKQNNTLNQFI